MARIPIACTLTAAATDDRIEEWRRLLQTSTRKAERTNQRQLRVQLHDSTSVLEAAVDLARREKACCAFFEFAIEIEEEATWLRVRVPPEASSVLDDFATLLPPACDGR